MRNKRGTFFELFLISLVLFLCLGVLMSYLSNQKRILSSLVSPAFVFEARDNLESFEMNEQRIILESLSETNSNLNFGSLEFLTEFRKIFLSKISTEKDVANYFSRNVFVEGRILDLSSTDFGSFLNNYLYPEKSFSYDNGKLVFSRSKVSKNLLLEASNKFEKVNFPIAFGFEFERKYLISSLGDKFLVEKI